MDFKGLGAELLSKSESLLRDWLPKGKLHGKEYKIGSLSGEFGESLSINIQSGVWKDFATGEGGADLISLYAAIKGMSQTEAYISLKSPSGDFIHPKFGAPTSKWTYHDQDGAAKLIVARYDHDGHKDVLPWTKPNGRWISKQLKDSRPLFNLNSLISHPDRIVLLVEGEKAAEKAQEALPKLNVTTWSGGCKAYPKTDFSALKDKDVILWPDYDKPGFEAMLGVASIIKPIAKRIRFINIQGDYKPGYDAADYFLNNDAKDFQSWAKSLLSESIQDPFPIEKSLVPNQVKNAILESSDDNMPHGATPSQFAEWVYLGIKLNQNTGNPYYNVDNAMIVLENHEYFKNKIWFDDFHYKFFTNINGDTEEWSDSFDILVMRYFQSNLGLIRTTKQMVIDAVTLHAKNNIRNEPMDWVESLSWDNRKRVESFFSSYIGAKDSEYIRAVSKNFWVSLIARIMKPGCKADNMVILEGDQGAFKSTALSIIGGKWYAETNENPNSKDFFQVLQGKILIELAELDSFNKAERNTIKKVMSQSVDRYRPPYGRYPQDFPRRCIFAGTTNDSHYLNDPTGARRFWPVKVGKIDLKRIQQDREQLFAEAFRMFALGEKWHSVPDSALDEQEQRRDSDAWEEIIEGYLENKTITSVALVLEDENCLGMDKDKINKVHQNRVGSILKILGWECIGTARINGKPRRAWAPKVGYKSKQNMYKKIEAPELLKNDSSNYSYAPYKD